MASVLTMDGASGSSDSPRPKKGILKPSTSFDQKDGQQDAAKRKGAKFDEDNIKRTYHPPDKDYGHMKVEEPKTPFLHYDAELDLETSGVPDDGRVDSETLAAALEKGKNLPPKALNSSSDEEDYEGLTPDEIAHKREFKKKRKAHYNEFQAVSLARKLMEEDLAELEEEEKKQVGKVSVEAKSAKEPRTPNSTPLKAEPFRVEKINVQNPFEVSGVKPAAGLPKSAKGEEKKSDAEVKRTEKSTEAKTDESLGKSRAGETKDVSLSAQQDSDLMYADMEKSKKESKTSDPWEIDKPRPGMIPSSEVAKIDWEKGPPRDLFKSNFLSKKTQNKELGRGSRSGNSSSSSSNIDLDSSKRRPKNHNSRKDGRTHRSGSRAGCDPSPLEIDAGGSSNSVLNSCSCETDSDGNAWVCQGTIPRRVIDERLRRLVEHPSDEHFRRFVEHPTDEHFRRFLEHPTDEHFRRFAEHPTGESHRRFVEHPTDESYRRFVGHPTDGPYRRFVGHPIDEPYRRYFGHPKKCAEELCFHVLLKKTGKPGSVPPPPVCVAVKQNKNHPNKSILLTIRKDDCSLTPKEECKKGFCDKVIDKLKNTTSSQTEESPNTILLRDKEAQTAYEDSFRNDEVPRAGQLSSQHCDTCRQLYAEPNRGGEIDGKIGPNRGGEMDGKTGSNRGGEMGVNKSFDACECKSGAIENSRSFLVSKQPKTEKMEDQFILNVSRPFGRAQGAAAKRESSTIEVSIAPLGDPLSVGLSPVKGTHQGLEAKRSLLSFEKPASASLSNPTAASHNISSFEQPFSHASSNNSPTNISDPVPTAASRSGKQGLDQKNEHVKTSIPSKGMVTDQKENIHKSNYENLSSSSASKSSDQQAYMNLVPNLKAESSLPQHPSPLFVQDPQSKTKDETLPNLNKSSDQQSVSNLMKPKRETPGNQSLDHLAKPKDEAAALVNRIQSSDPQSLSNLLSKPKRDPSLLRSQSLEPTPKPNPEVPVLQKQSPSLDLKSLSSATSEHPKVELSEKKKIDKLGPAKLVRSGSDEATKSILRKHKHRDDRKREHSRDKDDSSKHEGRRERSREKVDSQKHSREKDSNKHEGRRERSKEKVDSQKHSREKDSNKHEGRRDCSREKVDSQKHSREKDSNKHEGRRERSKEKVDSQKHSREKKDSNKHEGRREHSREKVGSQKHSREKKDSNKHEGRREHSREKVDSQKHSREKKDSNKHERSSQLPSPDHHQQHHRTEQVGMSLILQKSYSALRSSSKERQEHRAHDPKESASQEMTDRRTRSKLFSRTTSEQRRKNHGKPGNHDEIRLKNRSKEKHLENQSRTLLKKSSSGSNRVSSRDGVGHSSRERRKIKLPEKPKQLPEKPKLRETTSKTLLRGSSKTKFPSSRKTSKVQQSTMGESHNIFLVSSEPHKSRRKDRGSNENSNGSDIDDVSACARMLTKVDSYCAACPEDRSSKEDAIIRSLLDLCKTTRNKEGLLPDFPLDAEALQKQRSKCQTFLRKVESYCRASSCGEGKRAQEFELASSAKGFCRYVSSSLTRGTPRHEKPTPIKPRENSDDKDKEGRKTKHEKKKDRSKEKVDSSRKRERSKEKERSTSDKKEEKRKSKHLPHKAEKKKPDCENVESELEKFCACAQEVKDLVPPSIRPKFEELCCEIENQRKKRKASPAYHTGTRNYRQAIIEHCSEVTLCTNRERCLSALEICVEVECPRRQLHLSREDPCSGFIKRKGSGQLVCVAKTQKDFAAKRLDVLPLEFGHQVDVRSVFASRNFCRRRKHLNRIDGWEASSWESKAQGKSPAKAWDSKAQTKCHSVRGQVKSCASKTRGFLRQIFDTVSPEASNHSEFRGSHAGLERRRRMNRSHTARRDMRDLCEDEAPIFTKPVPILSTTRSPSRNDLRRSRSGIRENRHQRPFLWPPSTHCQCLSDRGLLDPPPSRRSKKPHGIFECSNTSSSISLDRSAPW